MESAPFPSASTVTLAILAGGEGSRMGQPKGFLRIRGKPILEYQLEQLNWPGSTWLISAPGREHPPGWERFDREISDPVSGLGPLRGVLTGLEHLTGEFLLVATVDMPGLQRDHLEWLVTQMKSENQIGILCRRQDAVRPTIAIALPPLPPGEGWGEGKLPDGLPWQGEALAIPPHPNPLPEGEGTRGGKGIAGGAGIREIIEPFPMLLRKESVVSVRRRIESGRLSVHGLLEETGFEAVETPTAWGERAWGNLNYSEDVRRFLEDVE
jgi:molybdopterin-guanine dinucleotide biosynthesis protein A